jgi:hypothetical protein
MICKCRHTNVSRRFYVKHVSEGIFNYWLLSYISVDRSLVIVVVANEILQYQPILTLCLSLVLL